MDRKIYIVDQCHWAVKTLTMFISTAMASIRSLDKWTVNHRQQLQICAKSSTNQSQRANQLVLPIPISRRSAILIYSLPLSFSLISYSPQSEARERRNRKTIPLEDYLTSRQLHTSFSLSKSEFSYCYVCVYMHMGPKLFKCLLALISCIVLWSSKCLVTQTYVINHI